VKKRKKEKKKKKNRWNIHDFNKGILLGDHLGVTVLVELLAIGISHFLIDF